MRRESDKTTSPERVGRGGGLPYSSCLDRGQMGLPQSHSSVYSDVLKPLNIAPYAIKNFGIKEHYCSAINESAHDF
jgi:hypothetical protein